MCILFISTSIAIGLVLLFKFFNANQNPPIYGIYQQKNKFYILKFLFMYILLSSKQLMTWLKRNYAVLMGKSDDGTMHIHISDEALEKIYDFGDQPMGIDAVYFNGCSQKGDAFICGLARRPKNVDTFVYLKVAGQDLLLTPRLPDTYVQQTPSEEGKYKAQGLEIVNFMPMRTWKLSYKGLMKLRNDFDKTVNVEIDLTWSAHFAPFNYDWEMSPSCMAANLAKEPWSRDYFKLLERYHQTHYEQMGQLKGKAVIDGKEHVLDMPSVRDHSFGSTRDWKVFHRYVLHFIFLENGDCMEIGTVSQPVILSHVTIGYYCRASDQRIYPVSYCNFKLYQHGENQILPKDYGFVFHAGGISYVVKVRINDEDTFYIGKEREAKFYERWSSVEVNGVKGWACLEWHYNNVIKN